MRLRRITQPIVSITQNKDEGEAVRQGLDLLKIGDGINDGDVVVITSNWVGARHPQTGVVVGYNTLDSIIRYFKERNPKRIVVAAGSGGGDTEHVMKTVGYDKIIQKNQVDFVDLNQGPFTQIKLNHKKPSSTKLNALIHEMTFHVSFTQLKIHEEGTVSASIKNMALSWPPTEEHGAPKKDTGIHENLHGFIAEMGRNVPIDLSIVSGSPAMVGTGPHNGKSVQTGLVICGVDPVAADTVGARLLGFKPQGIQYLYALGNDKIGEQDTDKIRILGISLEEAEKIFSQKAYHSSEAIVDKS